MPYHWQLSVLICAKLGFQSFNPGYKSLVFDIPYALHTQYPMSWKWHGRCCSFASAGQLQHAEQEAGRWRIAASESQAAVTKLEADIEGLSSAYNTLESHSHELEAHVQELGESGNDCQPD